MAPKLIFITGATGFIGSQVVASALNDGYRVRLSVRKAEQVEKLEALFLSHSSMLEFVIVPDITKMDAFDGKLDGVNYVFHLASPMPGKGSDVRLDYVDPAVQGTESMLHAAKSAPSVERVVVMASMLSLIPMGALRSPGLVVKG
jgi:nucleoside-diphosphate-sugar epimerase